MRRTGWIPGKENATDVLTKEILPQGTAMWELMKTNVLKLDSVGWALRKDEKSNADNEVFRELRVGENEGGTIFFKS